MSLRIKTRFLLANSAILFLVGLLLLLSMLLLQNHRGLERSQEVRYQSYLLAEELRRSSDELTRTARTYVVTGDPRYEAEYWHILDVRNGKTARPDGRQVPLRELMRELGFSHAEFAKLKEAEDNSNALVKTETTAFHAMKGLFADGRGEFTRKGSAQPEFARRIMHDAKYHADKELIMRPISEFERMLDARTGATVAAFERRSYNYILATGLIVAVLVMITVASYLVVQRPLLRSIREVSEELAELAEGEADLSRRLHYSRPDEIGDLVGAFNRLMKKLGQLIGQVRQSGIQVNTSAVEIAATAKQQQATANQVAATTAQIGSTAKEISTTSKELVKTMNEVNVVAEEAAGLASSGQGELARMQERMKQIMEAAGLINAKLQVMDEKASSINNIVTTISKVADQTNLLSLNAAIEAEKAADFGRGFAVVATEIRRLANQTAVATYDIERLIKGMQSAVSEGVTGMGKFAEEVRRGVGEVTQVSAQLAQIIRQVQALTPRFEVVNKGMQSQAVGAEQISGALLQLSDSTQQTVESLQQSNLAIEQLNSVAGSLLDGISRFKVDGSVG
ncbi:MAG TPA: methyl-accepting chemotaxis protein [Acidobacteriota bacterium]